MALPELQCCTRCGEWQGLEQFYMQSPRVLASGKLEKVRRHPHCSTCHKERCRAWRKAHPGRMASAARDLYERSEACRLSKRNSRYKRIYGITLADFDRMVEEQGGRCALCDGPPCASRFKRSTEARFHVDHCHKTGKVRALLCYKCNAGIALLNDDPNLMKRAAIYVVKHCG